MATLFLIGGTVFAGATAMIAVGLAAWKAERCPEGWFHDWIAKDSDADDMREEQGFDWRGLEHYHLYRLMKCTKCYEERKTLIYDSEPGSDIDLPVGFYCVDD